jgi:hypothetical protein
MLRGYRSSMYHAKAVSRLKRLLAPLMLCNLVGPDTMNCNLVNT